jgi:hypothetical protein
MIYHLPALDETIDQGDLIDGCPVSLVTAFSTDQLDPAKVHSAVLAYRSLMRRYRQRSVHRRGQLAFHFRHLLTSYGLPQASSSCTNQSC